MRVSITQADIDGGKSTGDGCPAALAVARATGLGYAVVTVRRIWVGPVCYPTPAVVTRFVEDFDRGRVVKPFEFELEACHE